MEDYYNLMALIMNGKSKNCRNNFKVYFILNLGKKVTYAIFSHFKNRYVRIEKKYIYRE